MVRVATLLKKYRAGIEDVSPDGLQHRAAAARHPRRARRRCCDDWRAAGASAAAAARQPTASGSSKPTDYTPADRRAFSRRTSRRDICPVLTPLAFDPGPSVPATSRTGARTSRWSCGTTAARSSRASRCPTCCRGSSPVPERHRARAAGADVRVPRGRHPAEHPRAVPRHARSRARTCSAIIRDTDMVIQEDEADDLLETVDRSLKQLRHGALSLLQVEADDAARACSNILVENFEVDDDVVVRTADRLGFADWMAAHRAAPAGAEGPAVRRRGTLWAAHDIETIFDEIRYQDYLVHHPFDSFASVESFLRAAVKRSARRRDQDDAVPHRPELAAGRPADRGGRSRQAGGGAGRAEGALRRAQQHHLGEPAGSRRASTSSTAS